jgi:hypothetical protein
LVDIIEKAEGEVLRYATGTDVRGVESGAGDSLVEFLREVLGHEGGVWILLWRLGLAINFSRSSKPQRKGVRAPTSIA